MTQHKSRLVVGFMTHRRCQPAAAGHLCAWERREAGSPRRVRRSVPRASDPVAGQGCS